MDESTKKVILKELQRFRGVGILISHDRHLLNQLCTTTIFMEAGTCTVFQASYDVAREAMGHQQDFLRKQREQKKEERGRIESTLQKQTERVMQGKQKLSKRNLDAKDHDTRAKINLARLTGADRSDGQKKRRLEERKERMNQSLSENPVKKMVQLGVFFGEILAKKRLHLPAGTWQTPYLTLIYPELVLDPGTHLAMTGPNGVGKSTFLGLWKEKLSHMPLTFAQQEISFSQQQDLREKLESMKAEIKGKIFTLVSCLGSDPKSLVAGSIPSPGMWQKLMIAKAIVEGAPVLFLDEPTNHMDLPAIEVLENALQAYSGVLVVISHDRDFLRAVCNQELCFKREGSTTYIEIVEGESK